ncbi:hypothetical protein [Cohnella lupini]|uniref:Uncharacterized protein n=1 Tax=Cohnella lupini TaxID=1294267 RepID=A0A3D9IX88_9BACL|nr:hypothetical protein [Cohnella lupini]RED66331.1 hypothetical protein DFP95_101830 [Cohnella lupini]
MTLFYYIASNRELPIGSFGQKKTVMTLNHYVTHVNPVAKDHPSMQILLAKYPEGDKRMEIYETEEDAAGLYIIGPIHIQDSSNIFRNPLVYQVNSEGGSFQINNEMKRSLPTYYQTSKKCLSELFAYLGRNVEIGEELELYCCWAHGKERFLEAPNKELNLALELSTFRFDDEFEWKERQYISIKK